VSVSGFVESPGVIAGLSESEKQQALLLGSTHLDSVDFSAAGLPISLVDSGVEDSLSQFRPIFRVAAENLRRRNPAGYERSGSGQRGNSKANNYIAARMDAFELAIKFVIGNIC
jgi:hypothetical protein